MRSAFAWFQLKLDSSQSLHPYTGGFIWQGQRNVGETGYSWIKKSGFKGLVFWSEQGSPGILKKMESQVIRITTRPDATMSPVKFSSRGNENYLHS
jgi:hypothetical protein